MDSTPTTDSAVIVAVVQEQVDAYNAHDIDRFLACYAPDVTITDGTGIVLYQGHEAIRAGYGPLFAQNPEMRVEIRARIVVGAWVVDEEHVTGLSAPGMPPEVHAIAVYRVAEGKIAAVQLLS